MDGGSHNVTRIFAKAGNRMGTARRYNLAILFLTLRRHEQLLYSRMDRNSKGIQILTWVSESVPFHLKLTHLNSPTKNPDFVPNSRLVWQFFRAIKRTNFATDKSSEDSLILPEDFFQQLKHAGLLK